MTDQQRWRFFRPRFTLAALLVLITVVSPPLGYIAHRRAVNSRRKAAYEALTRKQVMIERVPRQRGDVTETRSWWRSAWRDLVLDEWATEASGASLPSFRPQVIGDDQQIDDEDFRLLAYFPEAKRLTVTGPNRVTDDGLMTLARLPNLRELFIADMPGIKGDFLKHFSAGDQIENLTLWLDDLEGENLTTIADFTSLKVLSIAGQKPLDVTSLNGQELPQTLEDLTLLLPRPLSDVTLSSWLKRCRLRSLQLSAISRRGVAALANQVELQHLMICDSPLMDEDLSFLSNCSKLSQLRLNSMPIHGKCLRQIPNPARLQELSLDSTLLDDSELSQVKRFSQLSQLDLNWTPITGEGFADWGLFSRTCNLRLIGCEFSNDGKAVLAACIGSGPDAASTVYLPSNWTAKDESRIAGAEQPFAFDWPIRIALESAELREKLMRRAAFHLPSYYCESFADPLDNCPKDLMAPVLRLREKALARLDEEKQLEEELYEALSGAQNAKESTP